jgi:hypothetical protein
LSLRGTRALSRRKDALPRLKGCQHSHAILRFRPAARAVRSLGIRQTIERHPSVANLTKNEWIAPVVSPLSEFAINRAYTTTRLRHLAVNNQLRKRTSSNCFLQPPAGIEMRIV